MAILYWDSKCIASMSRKLIVFLSSPALARLHLEYRVPFWSPRYERDAQVVERVQWRPSRWSFGGWRP